MYTIEVFEGLRGWHVRLVHSNGKIFMTSEAYTRRFDALKAAKKLYVRMNKCGPFEICPLKAE